MGKQSQHSRLELGVYLRSTLGHQKRGRYHLGISAEGKDKSD